MSVQRLPSFRDIKLASSIKSATRTRPAKPVKKRPPLDISFQVAAIKRNNIEQNTKIWKSFVGSGLDKVWEFAVGKSLQQPSLEMNPGEFRRVLLLNSDEHDVFYTRTGFTSRLEALFHDKLEAWRERQRHRAWLYRYAAKHGNKRRALAVLARPEWVDKQELKSIYRECKRLNQEAGRVAYHVDHIVPISGKLVCGLHVPWNLQIIDSKANLRKSNKFDFESYF